MARRIEVVIAGDSSGLSKAMKSASSDVDGFGSRVGSVIGGIAKAGVFAGVAAGVVGVSTVLHAGIAEWEQSAQAASQTEAVLKSTGGAANVTAAGLDELTNSMLAKTGIDDELIKSGANVLLTFTQIRNEQGKGNDVFNQATRAATDLSVAMHIGLTQAALQVGKALNDPTRGMARLQRVGVAFTEQQKDMVKALVKSGDTIGAQKVILAELNKEFGGSAEAFGKTMPGKLTILKESFNNLSGQLVGELAPAFASVLTGANNFLGALSQAHGFQAKVGVVFDEAKNIAGTLATTMGSAVAAVDWAGVWGQAKGLAAGFASAVAGIDWAGVGTTIGDSISASVGTALSASGGLPTKILAVVDSIDWNAMGRAMGPGLAAAVVMAFSTLLDIGFWAKNWDLALGIAAVAFSGPLGRLGSALLRPFVKLGEDLVIAMAGSIERVSPRLGAVVLEALLRLPGIVTGALSKLAGLVGGLFARLGRLAVFTLKVLGIRAVIDKVSELVQDVIDWVRKISPAWLTAGVQAVAGLVKGLVVGALALGAWLIGLQIKIVSFFFGAASWLISAGAAIIGGLVTGIESKVGDAVAAVKGAAHSVISAATGVFKISSPSRVFAEIGQNLMDGMATGINSSSGAVIAAMRDKSSALIGEVNKLQAAIDKVNARRESEDRASAIRDAQTTLAQVRADAKSKQSDIVAAELALARAKEDVTVAARQRQLTADQAHYDKVQAALQKANDRIKESAQKASDAYQAVLDKARARAGTSFDRLADLVRRGFGALNDAWVSPAQQAINAITDRRAQEDLKSAVSDAQDRLSQAMEGDDPAAVADAQRALQRAQEDVLLAGLQVQAQIQQTAYDQQEQAKSDSLDRVLTNLRGHFTNEGVETSKGMQSILDLINTYDEGFGKAGKALGGAFATELRAAMRSAVAKASAVLTAKGGGGSVADVAAGLLGSVQGFELFNTPAPVNAGGGAASQYGTGDTHIHIHADTVVGRGAADELAQVVVDAVNRNQRTGSMRFAFQ